MSLRLTFLLLLVFLNSHAQKDIIEFTTDMSDANNHNYIVQLKTNIPKKASVDFSIPAWSPGYYQILNFDDKIHGFSAKNQNGESLRWIKTNSNTWRVYTDFSEKITIDYQVISDINFVGRGYLDENRAYIKPAAIYMYPENSINNPVILNLKPYLNWETVATGLEKIEPLKYYAANYDILYDSPLLIGNLKELPEFTIDEIPHRFIGYAMGEIDGTFLMENLKRIIKEALSIFENDIPYNHYTFIGIGPGNGGIEHLNSTAVSFTGKSLEGSGRLRTLSFLTHEYFHNFNAKRIRPVELGPFDYSQANRTNSLWVAEGLTSYYESIILNRAGFLNRTETLNSWTDKIKNFQSNEGRLKQSLAESSAQTWEDGPFGKRGETISYYEKGPFIGLFLDIRIRTATNNRYSLDDVMRFLYNEYYKKENRGFTDEEMIAVCEKFAGVPLSDIFKYVYTTEEMDYKHYFNMIGINMAQDYTLTIKKEITTEQKRVLEDLYRE